MLFKLFTCTFLPIGKKFYYIKKMQQNLINSKLYLADPEDDQLSFSVKI